MDDPKIDNETNSSTPNQEDSIVAFDPDLEEEEGAGGRGEGKD
jgi:hypothetical protein